MFKQAKTALLGLVGALLLASGAQAAPITYSVESVSLVYSYPTGALGCTDGYCNATLAALGVAGQQSVDTNEVDTFDVFRYVARLNESNPRGENDETLNVTASVALKVLGLTYTFIADGIVSKWMVNAAQDNPNVTGNPKLSLSWTPRTPPVGSPLAVIFNAPITVVQGNEDRVGSTFSVRQATSVVPLPGGVILLLTGLLGLVGLSRKRRAATV